jgi:hypothetical protein
MEVTTSHDLKKESAMRRTVLPLLAVASILLAACSKKEEPAAPAPTQAASAAAKTTAQPHSGDHDHGHDHDPKGPGGDAAKAHADHGARHGGVVTMEGDNHVEIVVAADGTVDLYVTDAVRRAIAPKEVSGTVTVEPVGKKEKQTLKLAEDAAKGSLSAKGPAPTDKNEYTWDLTVRGAPMKMTLRVPAGGTAAFAGAASDHGKGGDHEHGSPHGGVVQSLGDGHVEVKLEKSGDVTVWPLDSSEKPKPAKGWAATFRPVLPGAKDVKLDYDEKADALRGKVEVVTQEHVDAIVTLTPPGGTSTQLRFPFHFAEMGHVGH